MKAGRITRTHKKLYNHLIHHGYDVYSEQISKTEKIADTNYNVVIQHTPRSIKVEKEFSSIQSKFSSKSYELKQLITRCNDSYPTIPINIIISTLQDIDSYNKKIKRISKELISELEHIAIEKELSDFENVRDYPDVFPKARQRNRKVIAHLGDTNSGKTYEALMELSKYGKTAYLAPLRLLALENYDSLNEQGIPTSLITGEEQRLVDGSICTSSTIECFNFNEHYDLIIIDEVQMIDDDDRGWAFIQALVGANADKIILTGPKEYEERIRHIVEYIGDDIEVKKYKRKSKLKVDTSPTKLSQIKKNTAIVAFSRRDIYRIRKELPKNTKTSLVYGALGSDVRRLQAQQYINGETDILITTDAVGMGLNLPIEHIVFTAHTKFNGKKNTVLGDMLTKQISGRAGRFGQFDVGHVGAQNKDTLDYISQTMKAGLFVENKPLCVQPTDDYITGLLETYNLSAILEDWSENNRFPESSIFINDDMTNKIIIAKYIEKNFPEKVKKYHRLINCPVDIDKDMNIFKNFSTELLSKFTLSCPRCVPSLMSVSDLESKIKEMMIFMWFINQFNDVIPDFEEQYVNATMLMDEVNNVLHKKLSK